MTKLLHFCDGGAGSPRLRQRSRNVSSGFAELAEIEMTDWRSEKLDRIRKLIQEADPDSVEELKWRKPSNPDGVPTWSNNGILCTGETYKDKVKLTFARGASLDDPAGLFNASMDAGTRRAIDIMEGDGLDEGAFKALIKAAAEANLTK
jgi:hypothetical protein